MKTIIITIAFTLATVFAALVSIIAYEVKHIPQTYTCEKIGV